jgi:hypothetical protein
MSSSIGNDVKSPTKADTGFAAWSSQHIPRKDDLRDDYKSLRDNYKSIGDAYDRRQDTADTWETKDL